MTSVKTKVSLFNALSYSISVIPFNSFKHIDVYIDDYLMYVIIQIGLSPWTISESAILGGL